MTELQIHKVKIKKGDTPEAIAKIFDQIIKDDTDQELTTDDATAIGEGLGYLLGKAIEEAEAEQKAAKMAEYASITNCAKTPPPNSTDTCSKALDPTLQIKFGDTAKDTVTGFTGQVIALAQYATGNSQALLQPKVGVVGKWVDAIWIDLERIKLTPTINTTIQFPIGGFVHSPQPI